MSPDWLRLRSIEGLASVVLVPAVVVAAVLGAGLVEHVESRLAAAAIAATLVLLMAVPALHRRLAPVKSMYRALIGVVDSYRDGDFSFGLRWGGRDELGELVDAHNRLGEVLREQRLALTQRELLLDTMVQNTPVAMLLIAERGSVVFANLAARKLLNDGRRLEGEDFARLLARSRVELGEALQRSEDGVFAVGQEENEEVFHFSRRRFLLNGREHRLLLIRQLTHELRRQEVQTWKKVIRVMSHEMNNALGPIVSLSRSGAELLRRGDPSRLGEVLSTIEGRALHLDQFLRGYAQFAKLPTPRLSHTPWSLLLQPLCQQFGVGLQLDAAATGLALDRAQFTQAISNLIANALDAGSAAAEVEIAVQSRIDGWHLEVRDRGSGMSEEVMARALTPFYSTKRSGTGLGLALAREIIEAHGGRIALANREGGGLVVSIDLPSAAGGLSSAG